mmetsp:Transcript_58988/g.128065  ORF Transcript_58988/g.128065 Transcript_58988/m.128065 type:complete len:111 (+) Transcript_58988:738-1070(+)
MMKSCSTMKQVRLKLRIYLRITLEAMIRCSESRNALGSSSSYTSAGLPSANTMADRCNSPPESSCTLKSLSSSTFKGLTTSLWNWGSFQSFFILLWKSSSQVPGNLGEMV